MGPSVFPSEISDPDRLHAEAVLPSLASYGRPRGFDKSQDPRICKCLSQDGPGRKLICRTCGLPMLGIRASEAQVEETRPKSPRQKELLVRPRLQIGAILGLCLHRDTLMNTHSFGKSSGFSHRAT